MKILWCNKTLLWLKAKNKRHVEFNFSFTFIFIDYMIIIFIDYMIIIFIDYMIKTKNHDCNFFLFINIKKRHSYMFSIVGQTAGPNCLNFFPSNYVFPRATPCPSASL